MSTSNVSARNTPATNQILTANYDGSWQWSENPVSNSITTNYLSAGNVMVSNTLSTPQLSANTVTGQGSISINAGSTYGSYFGHPYGCYCSTCFPSTGGVGNAYTTGVSIIAEPPPQDEIKSKPKGDEDAHSHTIECRLRVETTKVISEYFCQHCNEILYSKVVSKLPKSILNKKCLPRICKSV